MTTDIYAQWLSTLPALHCNSATEDHRSSSKSGFAPKQLSTLKDPPCAHSTCTEEEHKICEKWPGPHQWGVHAWGTRKGGTEEAEVGGQAKEDRQETKKSRRTEEESRVETKGCSREAKEGRWETEGCSREPKEGRWKTEGSSTEAKSEGRNEKRQKKRSEGEKWGKGKPKGHKNTEEHTGRYVSVNVTTSYWYKPFKLCFALLTGTATTQTACERMTCHHPKARSWIECEQCGGWHHCFCAGVRIQKASVTSFICALCTS